MKVVVRSQHVLGPEGRTLRLRVFCPAGRRSVEYQECRACSMVSNAPASADDLCASIECAASESAPRGQPGGSSESHGPAGRDQPVGALAAAHLFCVHRDLPVDQVSVAFRESSGFELPVVDGALRLLGMIWRDDFSRARRPPGLGAEDDRAQRAGDCVNPATALRESSSIEHAVEVLTATRARTLILLRADDAVEGLLSDLELLRWLTRERRRRLSEALQ